jgi:hypothetical protein
MWDELLVRIDTQRDADVVRSGLARRDSLPTSAVQQKEFEERPCSASGELSAPQEPPFTPSDAPSTAPSTPSPNTPLSDTPSDIPATTPFDSESEDEATIFFRKPAKAISTPYPVSSGNSASCKPASPVGTWAGTVGSVLGTLWPLLGGGG